MWVKPGYTVSKNGLCYCFYKYGFMSENRMPPNPLLERIISLLKNNHCIGGYSTPCENHHVLTPFVDVLGPSWIILDHEPCLMQLSPTEDLFPIKKNP